MTAWPARAPRPRDNAVLLTGGNSIAAMGTPAPVPGIRGREAEIAVLGEVLDRVAAGRPAVALIDGEAGIGKTRLLNFALGDARGRDMQVVSGRAEELEQTRPFGVMTDAFSCARSSPDPRRAAIGGLLAGGGEQNPITVTSDPGLRFRVVDALADLAEEMALSGPLVIGLDDLQWADASSLLTLNALSRRAEYLPIGLIACFRPLPRAPELDRLIASLLSAGARQLSLAGLTGRAVADLVADMVTAAPGRRLMAGISGAAGNPLFVTEMLGALDQEGMIETSGGRAEVAQVTLPPTLRLTILRRLSFLPDDTLEALRAASILGSSFTITELSATMAVPALELFQALAAGISGRVLDEDGDRLRFRHDLIRDALYEDLPTAVRRGLHREAGQRLAGTGASSLQVAEHLARGAGQGDTEAISWLARAAREAAARSPDVAASLLGRAAGLMSPADPDRDRLLTEQAGSLVLAGRIPDALAACRSLLGRHHDPAVDGPARICLGHALLALGQVRDALQELERAEQSPALPPAERAAARAWAGFARISLGDLEGAAALQEASHPAASAGDSLTMSIAMSTIARISESRGQLGDAQHTAGEAVRLADESPGRRGYRFPVRVTQGRILIELDRLEDARSALGIGMRTSEELGVRFALATHQMYLAFERFIAGEWDDAIAEMEASLGLAEETGEIYSRAYAYGVLALISFHRNDLGRARESAAAADRDLAGWGGHSVTWAAWPHALIAEAGGEHDVALAVMAGIWDRCARSGLVLDYPVIGADLVRLALAAGDRERAADAAAEVATVASINQVAWMTGAALHCQGLMEGNPETLQDAASAYADGSRPLQLALACEEAGAAFARRDRWDRGHPLLDQAVGIYERLGCSRDLARAEALLRGAGVRRGRRGPRGRPKSGWDSLTPTEYSIAVLVAEGLSNPQIGRRLYISRRTVQTHLAHMFAKLDMSSRAQLAAEVTRRQPG